MLIKDVFGNNGAIAEKLGAYELRPQQIDMALAIEKSINENRHLIIEAGTGVGKSLAYLVPFIFWAVKEQKRIVISTYTKTLQEQLINKDLPFLRNALGSTSKETGGLDFSFALCVGGQNYLCIRRFNQALKHGLLETKKEIKEFQKIIGWEEQTKSGLRSELDFEPSQAIWSKVCRESDLCFGKKCLFKDDCYYNRAKRKEYKAHILVTNHHLFFANLVNEGRVLPRFDAVVFDEAHTLEDVATNYFGIEVSNFKVKFLLDSILNPKTGKGLITRLLKPSHLPARPGGKNVQTGRRKVTTNIEKKLKEVEDALNLFFSEIIKKFGNGKLTTRIRKKGVIKNYLNKPLCDLSGTLKSLFSLAGTDEERLEINAFANRCDEINKNISALINQDLEECVYWAEVEKRVKSRHAYFSNVLQSTTSSGPLSQRHIRCSLFAAPVNIAGEFKRQIFDMIRPVIMTSATLSTNGNFNYIKGRLGIPDRQLDEGDCTEKIVGSPFDFAKNALIYVPDNMPDPNLGFDKFKSNVTKQIKDILFVTQGRSFVLFTSFDMLNTVYEKLKDSMNLFTLLRQGDKPRYKLVEEYKISHKPVLFGTNTFWQGIDVPGKALECVIITKLPFAVPDDPIIEARMELLKARNKDPFTHYQLPQAIILLRQGFGRLIRTKADIGIVAILDPRVKTRYYGRHFLNSLPDCNKVSDIEDIKTFLYKHKHD